MGRTGFAPAASVRSVAGRAAGMTTAVTEVHPLRGGLDAGCTRDTPTSF